jgi:hypothetical protein
MNAKDVIRHSLDSSKSVIDSYINDLEDADLLLRPIDGMNHIAWQLGHLIWAERFFVEGVRPGASPPLPEGFSEAHGTDQTKVDDPSKFLTRARYQELMKAQREATKAVLDQLTDAELDAPAPERIQRIAPTVGAVFNLAGTHYLMHAGQFVAVRRKLGKPVVI